MRENIAKRVTILSFVVNTLLTISKVVVGMIGKSGALVADGIHSLSDLITDVIVYLSIRISSKPADEDHNYGHGKYETIASFIISIALALAGYNIAKDGITNLIGHFNGSAIEKPTSIILVIALLSVIVKEILYRYSMHTGKKISSEAIISNAHHQRSDAMSSLGVLISALLITIFGEKLSYLDAVAQIVVSVFLFKVAYKLLKPSLNQLTESALDADDLQLIKDILNNNELVIEFHHLRTRKIGMHYAIDVHTLVDESLTVKMSHDITIDLEYKMKEILGQDTIISIHVEPYQ